MSSMTDRAAECVAFVEAKVTTGYLIHSLAVVLQHLGYAARTGLVTPTLMNDAMRLVHDYLAQTMSRFAGDPNERHALEETECILSTLERGAMDERAVFRRM